MNSLSGTGQIEKGDRLEIVGRVPKFSCDVKVAEVICPGTESEEILIDLNSNKYFITSMVVKGQSWAKRVTIHK